MFGWFKKKAKESPIIKAMEETKAAIKQVPYKLEPHIDCECKDCMKRIKENAK